MAHVIAIANRKGGVGKTTTALNLGSVLAARGHRVLLVDLDSQQSLAQSLRVPIPKPGLADVLVMQFALGIGDLRGALTDVGGVTVAAGYDLPSIDVELCHYGAGWEWTLRLALEPELDGFDFVFLDCSPSLGSLTMNALAAADEVLVPVQTEFLAVSQLSATLSAVEQVRRSLNGGLRVAGFLPTLFDLRTRHAVEILMKISTQADRYRVRVFRPIPRTVKVPEASASGEALVHYAPRSSAGIAYEELATEIERRGDRRGEILVSNPTPSCLSQSQSFCERIAADHMGLSERACSVA